jgi:chromosomal replication initiation ATPase DnaA
MNIQYIEATICAEEKVNAEDLHVKTRERKVCFVRQMIMYFAIIHGETQLRAGGYFGLDHATANHAKITINNLCDVYKKMKSKIDRYKFLLREENVLYPIEQ